MNGRKLFREYAQSFNREAVEFVRIEEEMYNFDQLITKDTSGKEEITPLNYKKMINWIIKTKKLS